MSKLPQHLWRLTGKCWNCPTLGAQSAQTDFLDSFRKSSRHPSSKYLNFLLWACVKVMWFGVGRCSCMFESNPKFSGKCLSGLPSLTLICKMRISSLLWEGGQAHTRKPFAVFLLSLKLKTPNPPCFALVSDDGFGAGYQVTMCHLRFWASVVKWWYQSDAFLIPQGTGLPTPMQGKPSLPSGGAGMAIYLVPHPQPRLMQNRLILLYFLIHFSHDFEIKSFLFSHIKGGGAN